MECPRCKGRLKRGRTIDRRNEVVRYNRCKKCGEGVKTVELYVVDYESSIMEARIMAIRESRKAEQLELTLDTVKGAFRTLQMAVNPAQEPKDSVEQAPLSPRWRRSPYVTKRQIPITSPGES